MQPSALAQKSGTRLYDRNYPLDRICFVGSSVQVSPLIVSTDSFMVPRRGVEPRTHGCSIRPNVEAESPRLFIPFEGQSCVIEEPTRGELGRLNAVEDRGCN